MGTHPRDEELERFVTGEMNGLPGEPVSEEVLALSAHVAACTVCAERLAREARLEVALWEVARQKRVAQPRAASVVPFQKMWIPVFGTLAAAAVLMLSFLPLSPPSVPMESEARIPQRPLTHDVRAENPPGWWDCPGQLPPRECREAFRGRQIRPLGYPAIYEVPGPGKNWRHFVQQTMLHE